MEIYDVILSIKPEHINKIYNKDKTVELRKFIFKRKVRYIFIYATSPIKKIVAFFPFTNYYYDTIPNLWKNYGYRSGLDYKEFFKYFGSYKYGYLIEIENVMKFKDPIDPFDIYNNFKAPQSYYYVQIGDLENE